MKSKIQIIDSAEATNAKTIRAFFARPPFPEKAEAVARKILRDISREGDTAVARYAKRFDGACLVPGRFRVTDREIEEVKRSADADFKRAVRASDRRVALFNRGGKRRDWTMRSPGGGHLGERFTPIRRVGVYIPGGEAPLVSTAIMTVTLARTAGVSEIVACTPCGPDGSVNAHVLYALQYAGATEIYRVGGVQAIGAMAFGTRAIPKVLKIVGPGNAYVTAAKRQLYGLVDLDLVAGPSEIAVLADGSAVPRHVALDLLSQLEHGTGDEKALLITTSKRLAEKVVRSVWSECGSLSRGEWLRGVLPRNLLVVRVRTVGEALALSNRFAPEHLELIVRNPRNWLKGVENAGAVFLGPYTPESAGDFAAGPSHVLPTGGTAAVFSGLTAETFRKKTSVIGLTRRDLEDVLPVIETFGRVENLDAHAKSARARFEK